jgi:FkbM family methyltransferase
LWLSSRSGSEFQLRPSSCGNNDLGVAYEIFVHRYYVPPVWIPPERVKVIVDLGANVGLSCLYWLSTYWAAEIIAFEPHPKHAAQFRVNIARNRLDARTQLHPVAAGTASARAWISDEASSSRLSDSEGNGSAVDVVDVFSILAGRRIDILKIDIEGAEYSLFKDPRFGELDVRAIVFEWHQRADCPSGFTWCIDRLTELGFRLYPTVNHGSCGMMWGYRRSSPTDSRRVQAGRS